MNTDNPYKTPSNAEVTTDAVEESVMKRAKWRKVMVVMFFLTLPLFYFGRGYLNPIAIVLAVVWSEMSRRVPGPIEMYFVFFVSGVGEWYFYGWLLDTWSYRRRLGKASVGPERARHDGS